MDLFKLFFEHDLPLNTFSERDTDRSGDTEMSLEDFMKPLPTYSKFYLTGTRLDDEHFGLSALDRYEHLLEKLDEIFSDYHLLAANGEGDSFTQAFDELKPGECAVAYPEEYDGPSPDELTLTEDEGLIEKQPLLKQAMEAGGMVIYKEKAHHGFDLNIFSTENIYTRFFYPFRDLVSESFRFFSINAKRVNSERKFYFETWTLERPPHGAEEVFPETVL